MKLPAIFAVLAGMILITVALAIASDQTGNESETQPRLAIILVVDQMRADYLTRWSDLYTGGLHRLLTGGRVFADAYHDHAATVTATGHATIATGTIPAHHGIVGNSYFDRSSRRVISSLADSSVVLVGGDRAGHGVSPHNLMRTTIGDWLKEASPASKVLTASLKDRAAVYTAGVRPDAAFWYDSKSGDFISSSYYMSELPGWVVAFNQSGVKDIWRDSVWAESAPASFYEGSDAVAYEAGGEASSTFPHAILSESDTDHSAYYDELYGTPFADELLLKFASSLLDSERLGADSIPDLMVVSLSAADLVGHSFGPDSHEIEDYYLRLDKQLGLFLDNLDAHLGDSSYVLVLASDHGVCPLPEIAAENGMPDARRLFLKDFKQDVAARFDETFPTCAHPESLLVENANMFVIDSAVAASCSLSVSVVEDKAASALEQLDYVADVFTFDQLSSDSPDRRPFAQAFRNSFYPDRSADLIVNFKEGVLLTRSSHGTSHGSPYSYDTDVPIIIFGCGIIPGVSHDPVRTVDIAPAVAHLLGIPPDKGTDGHLLPLE